MSNSIPKELIDAAVRFHGHSGPFLILGLKAGLFANETLGKDYFKTRVVVETELIPPFSCFVDGIQFVTGCTMGKGNIELRRGRSLTVLFTKGSEKLRLRLKDDILKRLKATSLEESEKIAMILSERSVLELFHITRKIL